MSESTAIPLADVVRHLAHRTKGCNPVIEFAARRCDSHEAQSQYVKDGELEAWQTKHPRVLALDVCEELGDAVAYMAALAEKDERWLAGVSLVSAAFDLSTQLGWEGAHGSE